MESDYFLKSDYVEMHLQEFNLTSLGLAQFGGGVINNLSQTEYDTFLNYSGLDKIAKGYPTFDKKTILNLLMTTEFQRLYSVSYDDILNLTLTEFKLMVDTYNKAIDEDKVYRDRTSEVLHTDMTNVITLLTTLIQITINPTQQKSGMHIIDDKSINPT